MDRILQKIANLIRFLHNYFSSTNREPARDGCHLTCFCGDPQKLWHSCGSLSYIFQRGLIIARFTEQRNMTH